MGAAQGEQSFSHCSTGSDKADLKWLRVKRQARLAAQHGKRTNLNHTSLRTDGDVHQRSLSRRLCHALGEQPNSTQDCFNLQVKLCTPWNEAKPRAAGPYLTVLGCLLGLGGIDLGLGRIGFLRYSSMPCWALAKQQLQFTRPSTCQVLTLKGPGRASSYYASSGQCCVPWPGSTRRPS